ncbi:hypothetical protein GLOIN_2v1785217 [Rhizophagus irregularis DAOM 181602=DAOM 197198]|uniref:Uncharacterized protein n=1 Tax=Rhizophagus irregularis (strain DAOM 181602 / DAOM 197198 / MUCL 43194) TaxID=747089 RepID=U9V553_RHIID|nr:hypothetical protein GLOIN_2v1785217 [Rhizophagus irregularis DAOM 181602=DAOM 197198]POG62498.1 hypothetical protein GLOIN_2v1785217 [Rhizophagus irregularis DAOM 181602=DAOM 197198]CAG8615116.1 22105_t:CDS:2 [Rhizophagus irregularis]|eukprot:XP_025169364.1 hypothetical protein GLOIN_2v1785217 [Rhizophagus irregularis DAOM 181602=DAOM 197198]
MVKIRKFQLINSTSNVKAEEERKLFLKVRELQIFAQEAATRKALDEAEALELVNLEKKNCKATPI